MEVILRQSYRTQLKISYFLVFLSGISALIYEVLWQRYLAILLGAQARATAMVLAVFLGGMSFGYYCFGRLSKRKNFLFWKYFSLIELGLALWALLFPTLFHFCLGQTTRESTFLGDLFLSLVLMGVPTFLMGGTIPLLTQGLSRNLTASSRVHSRVYGYNTLGAGLGAFLSGFILIPETSFRLALYVGAFFNLIVAVSAYFIFSFASTQESPESEFDLPTSRLNLRQSLILLVGFFSGVYVISFETILIRLVGLSTGSSNYVFSLIVSIFIVGLALGGLMAKRIKKYTEVRLFWNQVILAFSLVLLLATVYYWPYWVHLIRIHLRDYASAFYPYQACLALLFFALFFIPTLLCGMVLPLCFHLFKDERENLGYRAGQLYSLNTIGCIFGAVLGGYYLLNFFNLDQIWKGLVLFVSLSAIVSYAIYLSRYRPSKLKITTQAVGFAIPLVYLFSVPVLDHRIYLQPFRSQEATEESFFGADDFYSKLAKSTKILFWKDGPNTTVGVGASPTEGEEASRSLFVNGKSDGNTRGDYFTTVMLGAIPALLNQNPESVYVIGYGTGITIGTLGVFRDVKTIDVAEISGTILENASLFDSYNGNVSQNPKVRRHEIDAFRYLSSSQKYDLIVSEPSNPWVTGIENLYSQEFYEKAKKSLSSHGYLVQWIHTYSFNDDLLKMVFKTMGTSFPYISVFQLKGGDLALLGALEPFQKENLESVARRLEEPAAKMLLESAGIVGVAGLAALEIMPPALVQKLGEGGEIHSLESPRLSQRASKAFFMGSQANTVLMKRAQPIFLEGSLLSLYWREKGSRQNDLSELYQTYCVHVASKNSRLCEEVQITGEMIVKTYYQGQEPFQKVEGRDLASVRSFQSRIPIRSIQDLVVEYNLFDSYRKYISPISFFRPETFMTPLQSCLGSAKKDSELWGECLLQKLIVMDTLKINEEEFKKDASVFLDWAKTVPKTSRIYEKVEQAKYILVRLLAK